MEKTLRIINAMLDDGVFMKYAIGGGIAVASYAEPIATYDLDIFIIMPDDMGGDVSPATIYDWMQSIYGWTREKGYRQEDLYVMIEGMPVQFIPAYDNLVREAVINARKEDFGGIGTFIVRAEYLISIMIRTGRPKDRERIAAILESTKMSRKMLNEILTKHGLEKEFTRLERLLYG